MTTSMPPWWPAGASETLVRECTCEWCQALINTLERERSGVAVDGENATLSAYTGGEAA